MTWPATWGRTASSTGPRRDPPHVLRRRVGFDHVTHERLVARVDAFHDGGRAVDADDLVHQDVGPVSSSTSASLMVVSPHNTTEPPAVSTR